MPNDPLIDRRSVEARDPEGNGSVALFGEHPDVTSFSVGVAW